MVDVAQLVRASDCGSEGRGFETHLPPQNAKGLEFSFKTFFYFSVIRRGIGDHGSYRNAEGFNS